MEPHIDGRHVRYLGPVHAVHRAATLARAHALLHLIDFDEPFGYSVVEAMASGTPVIANARGSMSELIDHGTTGYLVNTTDEAVEAVDLARHVDREAIRATAVARFDVDAMIRRYVAVYRSILDDLHPHRG